jgi:hypothetical protein
MLSTNVTTMTPDETLIVTAVVTDPHGIAQVVGGSLNDPGGGTYGAFAVSTTSGAYSLSLSWNAIETVKDITTPNGGQMRTFSATFYDQSGQSTTKSFSIQLQCPTATNAICAGNCADLQTARTNCGTCTKDCTAGPSSITTPQCMSGVCYGYVQLNPPGMCSTVCASVGGMCPGSATACAMVQTGYVDCECTY